MELSYYLAQLIGLSLAVFALLGLMNPKFIDGAIRDMRTSPLLNLLFGFIAIVVGLAIVLAHNIWDSSWRVVVTLVGWISLLKGITFLLQPDLLVRLGKTVYQGGSKSKLALFIALIVGAYIAYKGFGN